MYNRVLLLQCECHMQVRQLEFMLCYWNFANCFGSKYNSLIGSSCGHMRKGLMILRILDTVPSHFVISSGNLTLPLNFENMCHDSYKKMETITEVADDRCLPLWTLNSKLTTKVQGGKFYIAHTQGKIRSNETTFSWIYCICCCILSHLSSCIHLQAFPSYILTNTSHCKNYNTKRID